MGRPPHGGGPVFRFTTREVMEMEACLQDVNNAIPSRETIYHIAEKFSASADRAGKIVVQPKQVLNWFQNRKYALRAKLVKSLGKPNISPMARADSLPSRNAGHFISAYSGNLLDNIMSPM